MTLSSSKHVLIVLAHYLRALLLWLRNNSGEDTRCTLRRRHATVTQVNDAKTCFLPWMNKIQPAFQRLVLTRAKEHTANIRGTKLA